MIVRMKGLAVRNLGFVDRRFILIPTIAPLHEKTYALFTASNFPFEIKIQVRSGIGWPLLSANAGAFQPKHTARQS